MRSVLVALAAAAGLPCAARAANADVIAACIAALPSNTVVKVVNGSAGVASGLPLAATAPPLVSSGTCTGMGLNANPKDLVIVNAGDATNWGGAFTASTCGGTTLDTEIWVGVGCPTSAASFGCLRGNDDTMSSGCNLQSTAVATNAQSNLYFVLVSGFASSTGGSFSVTYSYTGGTIPPPLPTPAGTSQPSPAGTSQPSPAGTSQPSPAGTSPPSPSPSSSASTTALATVSPSAPPSPGSTIDCEQRVGAVTVLTGLANSTGIVTWPYPPPPDAAGVHPRRRLRRARLDGGRHACVRRRGH
jgi:hypothetical protein